jgi:hypothetical protein
MLVWNNSSNFERNTEEARSQNWRGVIQKWTVPESEGLKQLQD